MPQLEVGQAYEVVDDTEGNTYIVRGYDPVSNRAWLCVDNAEYDGYNGDLIVATLTSEESFPIVLSDNRCNLGNKIKLRPAPFSHK